MSDPFLQTRTETCKACEGKGSHTFTKQFPPPELMICRSCHGHGLLLYGMWDDDDTSTIKPCSQCRGYRYQKNEISQEHLDLHKKITASGVIHFDIESFRGIRLTDEEAKSYGLEALKEAEVKEAKI